MWKTLLCSQRLMKFVKQNKKKLAAISFLKVDREMTIIFEILFPEVFTTHLVLRIRGGKGIFINSDGQWKVS